MTRHRTPAASALTGVALTLVLSGCSAGTDDPARTPTATPAPGTPTTEPALAETVDPGPATDPDDGTGDGTGEDAPAGDGGGAEDPAPPAEGGEQPPADPAGSVTPFITWAGAGDDAGTIEVAAYVPDVIEQGGTCTATLVGTDVSATAPAFADATSTSCGLLVLDAAPAGGQTVVVDYESRTSAGASEPTAVTR